MKKYWINTVSRDHVLKGVEGGFTQANHGKATNLRKLSIGDIIIFYSSRTSYRDGETLRKFTAIGRIKDEAPYQVEMSPAFHPWRRRVQFFSCREAPIEPLIDELDFIKDKQHWGFPLRRGLFEIAKTDFEQIQNAMNAVIY